MLSRSHGTAVRNALAVILAVSFGLRFYNLGVPAQWMDEILVTLNASHPLAYILELSRKIEVHSPAFYLLIKSLMQADPGDFTLRLPAALCGTATVWTVFLLARDLSDESTGLYAAAFTSINPHHLLLSRYVRPYSPVILLFVLSLLFTWRASRDGRWRWTLALVFVNCLMLCLHDLAVLAVASQVLFLAGARLSGRGRAGAGSIVLVAASSLALTAALWWFFLRGSSVAGEFFAQRMGLWESFNVVGESFLRNLYYYDVPPAWAAGLLACLAGLAVLWRRERTGAAFLALFLFLTPAALMVTGMAWNLWPRHLSWTIPMAALCWGALACRMRMTVRGHALTAVAVCAVASFVCLTVARSRFYEVDSYRDRVIGTNYKTMAASVLDKSSPGDAIVVTHDYFRNGLVWYSGKLPGPDRFVHQTIEGAGRPFRVHLLSDLHHAAYAKTRQDFIDLYTPSAITPLEENTTLYTLDVPRNPGLELQRSGEASSLPMDLRGFYSWGWAVRDAVYSMDSRGPFVMATRNNSPAEVVCRFFNKDGGPDSSVHVNVYYRNLGQGSHLVAEAVFDQEPPVAYPLSMGPDPKCGASLVLKREKPFSSVTVTVRMVCAPFTPLFPGGNCETLRFEGMDAALAVPGQEAAVSGLMAARMEERTRGNYLSERFLPRSAGVQRVVSMDDSLTQAPRDEVPGWNKFVLIPGREAGVMTVELAAGEGYLVAYPRVGAGSSVGFYQVLPGGKRQELLVLRGAEGAWTPLSAQYLLKLLPVGEAGGTRQVEIHLQGKWAQLWNKEAIIFFAR